MMEPDRSATAPRPVVRREQTDGVCVVPASFAQQRLWFLDQWEPGRPTYNVHAAMRLTGPLEIDAFERSLNLVVARHEVLRTSFAIRDGQPVQIIAPSARLTLRILDLTALLHAEREAEAQALIAAEAHQSFDLACAPLIRALALRLAHDEHVVLVTVHHIVFDGWSMSVLLRELEISYNAFAAGAVPSPAPLPIQYADYTIWQRKRLQGEELERQLAYWRQQLGGPLGVLRLPTDHPRPAVLGSRGAEHQVRVSRDQVDKLTALSRRERVTLFMTLLAAFQTLLSRYTEQHDIAVGSAIAGRNHVELENLIGFFANTLVLRTDLSGDPTFRELLGRARDVTLGAYEHPDLPFEKLVEELHPERSLSHAPLCQAVLVLQNMPQHRLALRALTVHPFAFTNETAKFDVSLSLREGHDGLSGTFTYNTDLFEPSTIARMTSHFETLLEGITANPNRPLSELPILGAMERRQILVEWNDTRRQYPRDDCVHGLFETEAARRGDATAIVSGDEQVSYEALNTRANRLAHSLRARDVGAETRVAVRIDRSIDLVVALLGILKAGGAYVPIDPTDPAARVSFMLADAGVGLVVTDRHAAERLPVVDGVDRLYLDRERRAIASAPADNPERRASADDLAYVMYTSGSTGTPKAVTIIHRGIVRLVKEASYVSITPDDVMLQAAPIAFDASTFEIWGALLNGARLVLVPVEQPSLAELGDTLDRHQVTIAWFTSGLFNQMVDAEINRLRRVRQVLAGGDVLSVAHVRRFLQTPGTATLINGYGPTENTTFTCCYPMTPGAQVGSTVPIGRPISNTQVYVLDAYLNPQPIGVPGELYVGGDGLARGYWNRPDLTAAAFVANPFSTETDARLYKTGDRVRYRSDGNLEFIGRVDHQVKIRGFRVELGEIEAVLVRHPTIDEAVVVAREDAAGGKRLVAYVTTRESVEPGELEQYLRQHLPDSMVPVIVVVDALAKTSAGKVDRSNLPAPSVENGARHDPPAAPRNRLEAGLVDLWRGVLQSDRLGIHDNFFDLGGHSLVATQLIARIRATYAIDLPLRALFEAPTVATLATRLAAYGSIREPGASPAVAQPASRCVVALQPGGTKPPFFCVHGIGGEVQGYAALARLMDPDRPFYGLRAPLDAGRAFPGIETLAALYVEEVRKTAPAGPYFLGGYSSGATLAFEMARQLHASGDKVAIVAVLDSGLPNNGRSVRVSARALVESALNLFWWMIDDFMEAGPGDITARLRSRARLLRGRLATVAGLRWQPHREPDIRDVLGMPSVPQEFSAFLEQHVRSLMAYVPRAYPGQVTIFRARTQPLFRLREADLGWSRQATGGVDVNIVPGSHESILREPHVRVLGDRLRRSLDEAETRARALVG